MPNVVELLPTKAPGVIYKALPEGAVLFSTQSEVYYGLNSVGARVWEALPPARQSLRELCAELEAEFPDAGPDAIRADVQELLTELADFGLVILAAERPNGDGAHEHDAEAAEARAGRLA